MYHSKKVILGLGFISSLAVVNNKNVFNIFGFNKEKKSNQTEVYIWGNGEYQARPDVGLQFKNFEPKKIEKVNSQDQKEFNFQKIFFGEYHEAAIDPKGGMYIWKKKPLSSVKEAGNKDNERQDVLKLEKEGIQMIQFTKGYVWGLSSKGEVFSWPIEKQFNDANQVVDTQVIQKPRKIKTLPSNIVQISTGDDHFLALTKEGEVFAMGDDTYGQCGSGKTDRSTAPPFYDQRVKNPKKVMNLPKIKKIVCGHSHNLALSEGGQVYGWGSNSQVQLSQEEEFSKISEPLISVYSPIRLSQAIGDNEVTDIAAGENMSFLVTKNKLSGDCEVFSCGYNINGQLGLGYLRHVSDLAKMEGLSNYKITSSNKEQESITIKQIECGYNHCMALLSVGALMEWGQNEYGQLGNRKRVFSQHPMIVGKFKNDNIINISCGMNSSAVITEYKEKSEEKK